MAISSSPNDGRWKFMLRKILFIFVATISFSACSIIDQTGEVPELEVENEQFVFHYVFDSMVRKKLEYFDRKLVIEPNYNSNARGTVVLFSTPDHEIYKNFDNPSSAEYDISRVIALEGETIKIVKGQIYINDKMLDTFYGKLLAYGHEMEEYFSLVSTSGSPVCDEDCKVTVESYLKVDMDEVQIPKNHVFVMSDNSIRGIDSLIWGPLPIENIEGKVLGYKREK